MTSIAETDMSDLRRCFLPAKYAVLKAVGHWHGERVEAEIWRTDEALEQVGRAPPQAGSSQRHECERVAAIKGEWLRVLLREKRLTAYSFNPALQEVPLEYWARRESVGMLERDLFEPLEDPQFSDPIYFSVAEINDLLDPGPDEPTLTKMPLPQAMEYMVADALRSLSHSHLRRKEQYEVVRRLPQFLNYYITDRILRKAARDAPVRKGRPRKG